MERARLIVKNFGPLKDIDIEVREMVCLIGKQASGKSTLAKLIAIFEDEKFRNEDVSFWEELSKYQLRNFINKDTFISYKSGDQGIHLTFTYKRKSYEHLVYRKIQREKLIKETKGEEASKKLLDQIILDTSSRFVDIKKSYNDFINYFSILSKAYTQNGINGYESKLNELGFIFEHDSIYIPSERSFLHLISSNIQGLINNKIQIPRFLLSVGQEYEKAINNVKTLPLNIIDRRLEYKREGQSSYIYHSAKEKINLLESASGLQSVIPILLLIEFMNSNNKEYNYNFIIEEPELNLYPDTQHNLIKHMVANCLDNVTQTKNLVLTTHSPYVLSSINNLLMAYKKGQEKPKETAKVVKKKSWLDPRRFVAYEMKNGKAYSIVNKREGLIKENMIDTVADVFSDEFDRLLNI